ncbi:MAG TPA: hypothetical protein VGM63_24235 [Mucilaginibacter sp.]
MEVKDIIGAGVAIIAFYYLSKLFGRKRKYLLKNGIKGIAKIMSMEKTIFESGAGSGYSNAKPVMKIVLQLKDFDSTYREVTFNQAFYKLEIPKVGEQVNILIDPKNINNVMIVR